MAQILALAPRARTARRLRELRRVFARDQDGVVGQRSARLPRAACALEPRPRSANSTSSRSSRAASSTRGTWLLRRAAKRERFALTDEALRPYFPLPRVLDGLFAVAEQLSACDPRAREVEVCHPDVRFSHPRAGRPRRGGFYLDLYARPKKRGGAWMDECVGRKQLCRSARCRLRTWSATSRRPSASSPRC